MQAGRKENDMKVWKRSLAPVLVLALLLSLSLPAAGAEADLEKTVQESAAWMLRTVKNPQPGSIGGEWAVIGLARSGCSVPQDYWDSYLQTVEEYVKACGGVLHERKYTEYSRVILALTAVGADPRSVAGHDLTVPLGDFEKTIWQGLNGPVWALIALDSGEYSVPPCPGAEKQATRQMYVEEILSRQLDGGGWNLTEKGGAGKADPDMTAMSLQALAGYLDQPAVKAAVDRALTCLSSMQDGDGGYDSWGSVNSESTAQVLIALCTLGLEPDDPRFVKNGHTLLDNLLSWRQPDGSFIHTGSGAGSSQMASEQGLCALTAVLRREEGKNSLYRMGDTEIHAQGGGGNTAQGLPGKNPDVKKLPVTDPGMTFDDIAGENAHPDQAAIEALASRGVLKGKGDGKFDPDGVMTRAEFAAMTVRALGLQPQAADAFTDVPPDAWYAGDAGTASRYGIIKGMGDGRFNPEGTVTRQEAAAMTERAAKLCGMDTEMDTAAVRNMLAQFTDWVTAGDWARSSLAFCYREDILDQADLEIRPLENVRRCDMARMLFRMLGAARLL